MIHFVTVDLVDQVHAQGLGFTRQIFCFAHAPSAEDAEARVRAYLQKQQLPAIRKLHARKSVRQDAGSFTFPEQVIDLPAATLKAIYEQRGYPADWRKPGHASGLSPTPA